MTVPILNQPCTILAITPLVLLQCHCKVQGSTILQIFGLGAIVLCPNCGKGYRLIDPVKGEIQIIPAAAPGVM